MLKLQKTLFVLTHLAVSVGHSSHHSVGWGAQATQKLLRAPRKGTQRWHPAPADAFQGNLGSAHAAGGTREVYF